jgi:hypothetical protein
MNTFQKAKLALRKYLLNNEDKVKRDLDQMREDSKDERLEKLSDDVRSGKPVSFEEAIEVINYQNRKL